jgi:hypothetical protein
MKSGSRLLRYAVEAMLLAFGDDPSPLAETVRTLDDIITEFVISPISSFPNFEISHCGTPVAPKRVLWV